MARVLLGRIAVGASRRLQATARGMLARTRVRLTRATQLASTLLQATARGMLARTHARFLRDRTRPTPPGEPDSFTRVSTRPVDVVGRPTTATGGALDAATKAARGNRKHGKRKAKAAALRKAAVGPAPGPGPHELPGMLVWPRPRTPHAKLIADCLFPWMGAVADFTADQGKRLRYALVPRLELIERQCGQLARALWDAVRCEFVVLRDHPERHPGGCTTAFVRHLGAVASHVAEAGCRGDIGVPTMGRQAAAALARSSMAAYGHRDGFFPPGTTYGWLKPHQHLATAPRTDLFSHFQAACDEWVSAAQCSSSDDDSSDGSSARSDDDDDSSDDSSAQSDESDDDHGYYAYAAAADAVAAVADADAAAADAVAAGELLAQLRAEYGVTYSDDRDDTRQPILEPILEEVADPIPEPTAATAPVEAHPPARDAMSPATT